MDTKVVVAPSGGSGSVAHSAAWMSLSHFAPATGLSQGNGADGSAVFGRA